jgi:DNA-binding HxlR family transcriptional regulator
MKLCVAKFFAVWYLVSLKQSGLLQNLLEHGREALPQLTNMGGKPVPQFMGTDDRGMSMNETTNHPCAALEKIFHEPHRLAIMSALCAADSPLSFNEIKEACLLTDGNLSRHLKALEDFGAVLIRKTFVDVKPRTTVSLSADGLERFNEYLAALEDVLLKARQAMPAARRQHGAIMPTAAAARAG